MTETTIKKHIPFGEPISPDTAQGGFGFIPNGIREKNIFFYHPDHLGSSSYITGLDGKVSQHTEYIAFGEILFDEHNTEHTMPYLFNGKELDSETGLYYYGARYYDPKVSIFVNVDPLVEKTMQPYAYANNNPVMLIDPTGMEGESILNDDPIYGKNFWGQTKLIGDDGKNNGKAYLVKGSVKRDVKQSTRDGKNYTGSLTENDKVFKIPTGRIMDDVISSVNDTETSQKEHGGHANFGDINATRWDEGKLTQEIKDTNGYIIGAKASMVPFIVKGQDLMPENTSNIEYWWHTHPNTSVGDVQLGNSNPFPADFRFQTLMENKGFKGNTFVIGLRSKRVTFYNKNKPLITIKYLDFKKIGGK